MSHGRDCRTVAGCRAVAGCARSRVAAPSGCRTFGLPHLRVAARSRVDARSRVAASAASFGLIFGLSFGFLFFGKMKPRNFKCNFDGERERERERDKCFGFINNVDSRERGAKPFELFRCPSIRPPFCRQVADDERGTGGSGRNGRPGGARDRAPALCRLPAAFHRKGKRSRAGILFGSVLDAVRRWRGAVRVRMGSPGRGSCLGRGGSLGACRCVEVAHTILIQITCCCYLFVSIRKIIKVTQAILI